MPNFFMIADNHNNISQTKRLRDLSDCVFERLDIGDRTMNWMEFVDFEGAEQDANLDYYTYGDPYILIVVPWMTHQEYAALRGSTPFKDKKVTANLYNNREDTWAFYNARMIWPDRPTWNRQRGLWENVEIEFRELDEINA